MSRLIFKTPDAIQPTTTAPKRFGLSAAELRAKRAAKKAERAEIEHAREIDALVQRVAEAITPIRWGNFERRVFFSGVDIFASALSIHNALCDERFERQYRVELECLRIRDSYLPIIEQARLETSGSATKRALKRQQKEAQRQRRAERYPAA